MTESRLVAGGEVGGGDLGLDDADVATANATAAVEVLLLDRNSWLSAEPQGARESSIPLCMIDSSISTFYLE